MSHPSSVCVSIPTYLVDDRALCGRDGCSKKVENGMQCDWCNNWYHYKCTGLTEGQATHLKHSNLPFMCIQCIYSRNGGTFPPQSTRLLPSSPLSFDAENTSSTLRFTENVTPIVRASCSSTPVTPPLSFVVKLPIDHTESVEPFVLPHSAVLEKHLETQCNCRSMIQALEAKVAAISESLHEMDGKNVTNWGKVESELNSLNEYLALSIPGPQAARKVLQLSDQAIKDAANELVDKRKRECRLILWGSFPQCTTPTDEAKKILSSTLPVGVLNTLYAEWFISRRTKRSVGLLVTFPCPTQALRTLELATHIEAANPEVRGISQDKPRAARKTAKSVTLQNNADATHAGAALDEKLNSNPQIFLTPCDQLPELHPPGCETPPKLGNSCALTSGANQSSNRSARKPIHSTVTSIDFMQTTDATIKESTLSETMVVSQNAITDERSILLMEEGDWFTPTGLPSHLATHRAEQLAHGPMSFCLTTEKKQRGSTARSALLDKQNRNTYLLDNNSAAQSSPTPLGGPPLKMLANKPQRNHRNRKNKQAPHLHNKLLLFKPVSNIGLLGDPASLELQIKAPSTSWAYEGTTKRYIGNAKHAQPNPVKQAAFHRKHETSGKQQAPRPVSEIVTTKTHETRNFRATGSNHRPPGASYRRKKNQLSTVSIAQVQHLQNPRKKLQNQPRKQPRKRFWGREEAHVSTGTLDLHPLLASLATLIKPYLQKSVTQR